EKRTMKILTDEEGNTFQVDDDCELLTTSERESAQARLDYISRFVEEGSENEFYLCKPYTKDAKGFWCLLRDGFAQSSVCGVHESELNDIAAMVDKYRTNPYDAMNAAYRNREKALETSNSLTDQEF